MSKYIRSAIPYMGNKYKLLKTLIPLFPSSCGTFVDLFGGSATVCINYQGKNKTIYNEINHNIVELVKMFKKQLSRKFKCLLGSKNRKISTKKSFYKS